MSEPTPRSLEHHAALDARLVAAARGIRLLEAVSRPEREQAMFLGAWRVGRIHLPDHEYPRGDHAERRRELQAVFDAADPDDIITVVIPEFVTSLSTQWLHNQSGLAIKARLLYRPNTVVTSVPVLVD